MRAVGVAQDYNLKFYRLVGAAQDYRKNYLRQWVSPKLMFLIFIVTGRRPMLYFELRGAAGAFR